MLCSGYTYQLAVFILSQPKESRGSEDTAWNYRSNTHFKGPEREKGRQVPLFKMKSHGRGNCAW